MLHYNFHIEKELLAQLSAGDEQAFRDLFDRYYGKLYHYFWIYKTAPDDGPLACFLDASE